MWIAAGDSEGVGEAEAGGQLRQQDEERRDHAGEDDADLIFLREVHRVAAAGDGVDDDEQAAADDGQVEPPAQDGGEHDGRRVNRDAGAEAALQQEERRAEQAGFRVEASARDIRRPCRR